ncbi:probable glutathione S-transferase parC [Cryptomeria japonica]|uniref:probable glutathione S-transferase parC n=1 Tax=Cryptomeria japonica TaxID=3369 RepID=UPI0025AD5608|nr:probable glutathione S-transferase parC [Cryptomeria japonica]XP_057842142.1 probable glutathione S-transferase parC [Cryptomeria japonica]XP_057842143.1 probable glutathione S-transferase parC [Cryptomeria japonica]
MEQVKVLSTWISMFGMRVVIALEEKGVKYEYQEEVLSNKSDLLLQMNPVHKKIPVLVHNGQPVCESLIIVQYIDDAWDSTQFLPSKPYDRALARFWADFTDKKFYDAGARIMRLKDEAQEQAKRDLLECFQLLEGALKEMSAGGSLPFFNGKDFGFLDIAFIPFASWFPTYESFGNFKIPLDTEYPLLGAWVKRCMERDSVKKGLPSPDKVLEFAMQTRKRVLGD